MTPDLSTWGKALGNGFPISALAGRRELMELGGLRTERPRVFLLSTTHGRRRPGWPRTSPCARPTPSGTWSARWSGRAASSPTR